MNIWNFWAKRYEKLWVQKYSLRPTRDYILKEFKGIKEARVLDIGSGPGQLLEDLSRENPSLDLSGLDFSEKMIQVSKEKNPNVNHYLMDVEDLDDLRTSYDYIISTHSIPYYKKPDQVMENISKILANDGRFFIAFASGTSFYDKLVLSLVKLTTGPANYLSDEKFRGLTSPYFRVEDLKIIRVKKYMPRIALYTLSKNKEG